MTANVRRGTVRSESAASGHIDPIAPDGPARKPNRRCYWYATTKTPARREAELGVFVQSRASGSGHAHLPLVGQPSVVEGTVETKRRELAVLVARSSSPPAGLRSDT